MAGASAKSERRRQGRTASAVAGGLLAVLSAGLWGCAEPPQGTSCLSAVEECPSGTYCDAETQLCQSLTSGGRCRTPEDCREPGKPLCRGGSCTTCLAAGQTDAADAACRALGRDGQAFCIREGAKKGQCGECRVQGPPSQCSDPARPICDAAESECRPCQKHGECASGLCNDGSGLVDIEGIAVGACARPADVRNIDATRCPQSGADGTLERPFCNLGQALGSGAYLIVQPRAGQSYPPVTIGDGRRTVIVGAGREQTTPLLTSVTVTGSKTAVTLVDVTLASPSGTALSCTSATAQLVLVRGLVQPSALAVDAPACEKLELSSSQIQRSKGVGVRLGAQARYRIVNTAIVGSGGPTGVQLASGASGLFAFNTLINNGAADQDGGAVTCELGSSAVLQDSLIVQNGKSPRTDGMGRPLGTQFVGPCQLLRVVVGIDAAAALGPAKAIAAIPDLDSKLRLMDTPNNAACCVDKIKDCQGLATDYFGGKRPLGAGCDLGIHELK